MHKRAELAIAVTGIFGFWTLFGFLQELITRSDYDGEKFTFGMTLVCIEVIFYSIFAKVLLAVNSKKEDETHKGYYACIAVTYLIAMVSSMKALQWVAYPTQVIGKSIKPIPVMILAVLIGRKSYSIQRYFFVFVIVAGVIVFKMKNSETKSSDESPLFGIGEALLLLSLTMDGFTGAIQERVRATHKPTAQHFMFSINAFASLILIVVVICTGEILSFIPFVMRYPRVIYQSALLALCGAIGQVFIFIMVSSFGCLPCSITTTVRKLVTVLCSVFYMGNIFTSRQWIGTSLVFAGLLADAIFGKKSHQPAADENDEAKNNDENENKDEDVERSEQQPIQFSDKAKVIV